MLVRDVSGTERTVTGITVRDASNTLRQVASVLIRDTSGTSRTVFNPGGSSGSANALSPDYVDGYGYSKSSISVSTSIASVNAPQGATIVWNFSSSGWQATNPTAPSTAFRHNAGINQSFTTSVTCTVTINGRSYTTNSITAYVENTYGGTN